MKNSRLIFFASRNVAALAVYVVLVAAFFRNAEKFLGQREDTILAPISLLMLFVLSALVCGTLALGQPIWLYLEGQKKEALKLLGFTIGAMFLGTILVLAALFLI